MHSGLLFVLSLASVAVVANPTPTIEERGATGTDAVSCVTNTNYSGRQHKRYCGMVGALAHPAVIATTAASSINGCAISCQKTTGCISFGFDTSQPARSQCTLLSKTLRRQKLSKASSGPVYYNKKCFKCQKRRPAPQGCSNEGVGWALYPNSQGSNNDNTYSTFNPSIYQTTSPSYDSTTTMIGGWIQNHSHPVYHTTYKGGAPFYVLNHRGYIYAPTTGTYTLDMVVDDAAFFWLGTNAYTGYTRSNENFEVTYNIGANQLGTGTYTFHLQGGQYYPFRIVYAEADPPAELLVSISDPLGFQLINSKKSTGYVVQYSCDQTTAPQFQAWGNES